MDDRLEEIKMWLSSIDDRWQVGKEIANVS